MKNLGLNINYQCNNACPFCSKKDLRHCAESPIEELTKKIKAFAANKGERLIICGGEPLISKHLFNLLILARQKGIKFLMLQTNARMLYYKEMVEKLKEFEPINFLVSFHFPDAKLYKKYTGSDGFYQTLGGIKNLIKYNCNFVINTVIMKQNLPHLKRIIKILKPLGVKKIQFRFIDGEKIIDDYEKFVPRYQECVPIIKKVIDENPDMNIKLRSFPSCVLGEEMGQILSRGNPDASGSDQFIFPNCRKCIHKPICLGVKKEYVKMYGIKEFEPYERNLHNKT